MTTDTEPAIDVEHLTKRYDDLLAVDDVSFTVKMGELFAFVGPNGAGKTTTVEIIDTIRTPTSGRVRLLGVRPQGFTSFDRITVTETIQYYSRLFSRRNPDVEGLIHLVNLQDKSKEQFQNLSGGLKQRLGIAVALVNDPEVVFLDEPTTGLDPRARREVWKVLVDLKKKGKTVFLTTHYMEEAELLADTVAIISKGQIIAMGPPEELIQGNATYLVLDDHRNITVNVEHPGDVRTILNTLTEADASFLTLDVRKPSLEAVFLALTGEALRQGSPETMPE
jgi:ABC-2 type transport system ATP-binding protein